MGRGRNIAWFALLAPLAGGACEESEPATGHSATEAESADSTPDPSGEDPSGPEPTAGPDTADSADPSDTADTADTADTTEPDIPGGPDDPPTGLVRFVALGDGGEGNDSQYAVADIVEQVCTERGCDFAIYLGDNFYDVGVDSTMDVQFQDKFELPYADIDFPFYITLGNHDYGELGNEWLKSEFQVEYSEFSEKWTLPSEYYVFDTEHVTFISLDTSRMFWNHEVNDQAALVQQTLAQVGTSKFTVAFGHHPYISNGRHGNAGNYEGVPLPVVAGDTIEDFFDDEICGKVTVYFSGHDHNRQWHPQPQDCVTHFVVSGAAAKTTDFEHRDGNPTPLFEDDATPGFAWVEIEDATMTVAFYDETGAKNFEDSTTLQVAP